MANQQRASSMAPSTPFTPRHAAFGGAVSRALSRRRGGGGGGASTAAGVAFRGRKGKRMAMRVALRGDGKGWGPPHPTVKGAAGPSQGQGGPAPPPLRPAAQTSTPGTAERDGPAARPHEQLFSCVPEKM